MIDIIVVIGVVVAVIGVVVMMDAIVVMMDAIVVLMNAIVVIGVVVIIVVIGVGVSIVAETNIVVGIGEIDDWIASTIQPYHSYPPPTIQLPTTTSYHSQLSVSSPLPNHHLPHHLIALFSISPYSCQQADAW